MKARSASRSRHANFGAGWMPRACRALLAAWGGSGYRCCMKLKGTIRRSDLEGGHWLIETTEGDQYQLVGKTDGCKDGMQAEVEGNIDKNAMGIGMTGPHFTVHSLTAL
jgi:hypothetical protein